uniref:Uncharacterized protein n=1 Tax=Opuntia streptacantha TaxID=393608 RepID=A0A7C9CGY1_OPUST
MDLYPAIPFPSTGQISKHEALRQETQHATRPSALPGDRDLNYHRLHQYGSAVYASSPPGLELTQMMDEHHCLFFEHKHKKDLFLAMLLILQPPQRNWNGRWCHGPSLEKSFAQRQMNHLDRPFTAE